MPVETRTYFGPDLRLHLLTYERRIEALEARVQQLLGVENGLKVSTLSSNTVLLLINPSRTQVQTALISSPPLSAVGLAHHCCRALLVYQLAVLRVQPFFTA